MPTLSRSPKMLTPIELPRHSRLKRHQLLVFPARVSTYTHLVVIVWHQ